jgi:hypothetical protein
VHPGKEVHRAILVEAGVLIAVEAADVVLLQVIPAEADLLVEVVLRAEGVTKSITGRRGADSSSTFFFPFLLQSKS